MFWAAALCAYLGPAGSGEHGGYRFRTVKCSRVPRRFGWDIHEKKKGREGLVPKQVLTRRRSLVAKLTVLAVIASLLAIAVPASAAIDTSASCPSTIPSSGFTDIGGFDATTQLAINCLVHYGITQGTSATTFTPNGSVSRWQMALFLTRQAVDHGLTLGDGSSQGFTDIGGFDAATQTAINQLAQLDITQGTSATTFEPNLVVSRWQMALFLTRLADAAGVTLPSGAAQGFTDISTLSAEAQTAINQAKQLGIADGFSATTFSPFTDTLRWQMALFLTRTLAVDGVLPTGLGFTVTAFVLATDVITYDDAGTSKTVDYTPATSFTVDGVAATLGAFEAALSVGDKIAFSGTGPASFALTNVAVTSGLVNDVELAADTLDIILSSGPILTDDRTYIAANTTYSVGGTVASLAGFENNLSNGDTINITGAGTAASPFVFALTNATASGTISGLAGNAWNVTTAGGAALGVQDLDVQVLFGDTLSLTVDAVAATQATFDAALTNGDVIAYSRAAGVVTAALTSAAPTPLTGRVLGFVVATDVVTYDVGPAAAVTYDFTGVTVTIDGAAATVAEVNAALNVGDSVTTQIADADSATTAYLHLVNGAVSGTPTGTTTVAVITIKFDANGPASSSITHTNAVDPLIVNFPGIAGNTTVVYQINGTVAVVADWVAAANGIAGGLSGSVAVSDSGVNTVWNITSP